MYYISDHFTVGRAQWNQRKCDFSRMMDTAVKVMFVSTKSLVSRIKNANARLLGIHENFQFPSLIENEEIFYGHNSRLIEI